MGCREFLDGRAAILTGLTPGRTGRVRRRSIDAYQMSSPSAAIHVEALTFTYPGAHRAAIQNVNFTVERGEIFGFLGPSGAGKSTTQNILIRLIEGYSGVVHVLGR